MNIIKEDIEDFKFVYDAIIKYHCCSLDEKISFTSKYKRIYEKLLEGLYDLEYALSLLTSELCDGHTNIELPYSNIDLCIHVFTRWVGNKLLISKSHDKLSKGDQILLINSITIDEYIKKLSSTIPHENEYLLKSRTTRYPYKNYHMFSEWNLKHILNIKNNEFTLTVLREDKKLQIELKLEPYNGCCDFIDLTYSNKYIIEDTFAVLLLYTCNYDENYKKLLQEFFCKVENQKIEKIYLDLRENMGGNSSVIHEFLQYLSCNDYIGYNVQERNSHGNLINIQSRSDKIKNIHKTTIFSGEIICFVSHNTFSSARTFATILKDNNLAKIVGEYTGGKPCSYGAPIKLKTPNSLIRFRVSTKIFRRPNSKFDNDITLLPNFYYDYTLEDRSEQNIKKLISK